MVKLGNVGWLLNEVTTIGSNASLKLCQVTVDSDQGARTRKTEIVPGPLGGETPRAVLTLAVVMWVLGRVGMALRSNWKGIRFSPPPVGPVFIVWEAP